MVVRAFDERLQSQGTIDPPELDITCHQSWRRQAAAIPSRPTRSSTRTIQIPNNKTSNTADSRRSSHHGCTPVSGSSCRSCSSLYRYYKPACCSLLIIRRRRASIPSMEGSLPILVGNKTSIDLGMPIEHHWQWMLTT
jgi:hypothetical protein